MAARQKYNDRIVASLRSAVNDGQMGLADVPDLVKRVLSEKLWRTRVIQQTEQKAQFDNFIDFVETLPLEGLGTNIKTLQRLCADDPEALDLLDRAIEEKRSRRSTKTANADNVSSHSYGHGNSRQYALRRLRKERPDLHAKVLAGKLSAHRAMQEAGFRRHTIIIPAEPVNAAQALAKHFKGKQMVRLLETLQVIIQPHR